MFGLFHVTIEELTMFAKHINYSKIKGPGDFSPEDGPEDYEAEDYEVFEYVIGHPNDPDAFNLEEVTLHLIEDVDLDPVMKIVMKLIGDNDEGNKDKLAEAGALLVSAARDWFDSKANDVDVCNAIHQAIIDKLNEP